MRGLAYTLHRNDVSILTATTKGRRRPAAAKGEQNMRNGIRLAVAAAFLSAPVWAGVTFTAVTTTEGRRGEGVGPMTAQIWAEGGQAKVEFTESSNPLFTQGTYMLVDKKGEMTFVNPEKQTYGKFDLDAMMENVNSAMGAMAKMGFGMEVENPKVEKVLEEPGGTILGYPTTHYRWHTTYTMVMHMPRPMKDRRHEADMMEDVWTTTGIAVPTAASKLFAGNSGGPAMKELGKLMEVEKAKMTGFALKRVVVTSGANGEKQQTTMEVKDLKTADIPASTFQIPAGYTETDLMQPQRGPAMPNLNKDQ
jgi:hypothetical protein